MQPLHPPAASAGAPTADDDTLFSTVVGQGRRRRVGPLAFSVVVHAIAGAALVLVPILMPETLVETAQTDVYRLLIYDPPPPPPPPLPLGSVDGGRRREVPETPPTPTPVQEARLEAPVDALVAPTLPSLEPDLREGIPTGSEGGVPEGMAEGVEGGIVGGVPGGVVGGVIGGTGTGLVPVYDYDRAPRLLNPSKPKYPPDAFVRKVEGVVVVEFVIDSHGRVVRARIVQSIPLLDAAALETVRGWIFSPAVKRGQAVATAAQAPVTFRIF
jgi:protein TonB